MYHLELDFSACFYSSKSSDSYINSQFLLVSYYLVTIPFQADFCPTTPKKLLLAKPPVRSMLLNPVGNTQSSISQKHFDRDIVCLLEPLLHLATSPAARKVAWYTLGTQLIHIVWMNELVHLNLGCLGVWYQYSQYEVIVNVKDMIALRTSAATFSSLFI